MINLDSKHSITSVKLTDFGLATQNKKYERHFTFGSKGYMPPEILEGQFLNHKIDIWSLGILLFKMVTGKMPCYVNHIDNCMNTFGQVLDIKRFVNSL